MGTSKTKNSNVTRSWFSCTHGSSALFFLLLSHDKITSSNRNKHIQEAICASEIATVSYPQNYSFNILSTGRIDNMYRNSFPEVFLRKGVLKICSKFTGELPCPSVISMSVTMGLQIN